MLQKQLADWAKKEFNLLKAPSQSTISNILNNKRQIQDVAGDLKLKRPRVVKLKDPDDDLAEWVICCQEKGICLNWDLIKKKAALMADRFDIPDEDRPAFSDGWLQKFMQRPNFKTIKLEPVS